MTGQATSRYARLSRRSFLLQAGGCTVAVSFAAGGANRDTGASALEANAWVTIRANGEVIIQSAPAEMGQGTMTGLPACLAEELDADWSLVRVVQSPALPKIFGNPLIGMDMSTHGDFATRGYFLPMRLAGAQARRVLLANAARLLNQPLQELETRPGMVVHAASSRHISYGAIARQARIPAELPAVTTSELKPRQRWRLIGMPLPRVDLPSKINGSAIYGIDVRRPGMLHATMLYPPVPRERPLNIDAARARAVPGVIQVVPCEQSVGVIAESVDAARRARDLLRVRWSTDQPGRNYDSGQVLEEYRRIAADVAAAGTIMDSRGDAAAGLARSSLRLTRQFCSDHVAHAAIEPTGATALVTGDRVVLWLSTQSPSAAIAAAARAAGVEPGRVEVHSTFVGGGFGRLSDDADNAFDAVLLAGAVPGRPVKLQRTREDDFLVGKFRPLAVQQIDVGLDADGSITAWRHRIVSASVYGRSKPELLQTLGGKDWVAGLGGQVLYGWPNHQAQFVRADRGMDVGPYRGIAFGYTAFAIESLIDELAARKAQDPLDFRLGLLAAQPRAQAMLRHAAAMAGWGNPRPAGRALGLAFSSMSDSIAALCTEISLDVATGDIRVHRIWCCIDAGTVVHPDAVTAQLEGGIIMGLGPALYERFNVRAGAMQELNFHAYRPPRMSQIPEQVDVKIVASEQPPGGVGEIGVILVAPAIANGVAALTGRRLRALPLLPERVRAILQT